MASSDEIQKVNIALNKKIHTQAKLIAVLKQVTLKDYFQKAIEQAIEQDRALIENLVSEKEERNDHET
ncbi:hypothetical protein COY95_00540 [Candidatus Woesearchaeota archaeon CG_4_10_14_0_8_um_filter_47_5]|nr:MAG: hypothetical protein COY95_00540 [Candidatus Woesearchaeota archaeon CG_4_10_14_0_8_um_filter_47_5]